MAAPTNLVTVGNNATFVPTAAQSFVRAQAAWGQKIKVNSSYRDWMQQYKMYLAWQAYVNGTGLYPGHGFALHPDRSKHCQGLALDTDDHTKAGFVDLMAEHGWVRTALAIKEYWHFEYQQWRDKHFGEVAGKPTEPETPEPKPEETPDEEEEMGTNLTVHFRTSNTPEWTLGNPGVGLDLEDFPKGGAIIDGKHRRQIDTKVWEFLGCLVTTDPAIGLAWSRIHAGGSGKETSRTEIDEYQDIQRELRRVAKRERESANL